MSLAVKRYATALMDVSLEEGTLEETYEQFKSFYAALREEKDFKRLLTENILSADEKKDLVEKIMGNGQSYLKNFLFILIDRKRSDEICDIFLEFEDLYKEKKNILECEVVTAVELSSSQKKKITEALGKKYNKNVTAQFKTDESILGGMVVYVGNDMIDGSVKTRFEDMREKLHLAEVSEGTEK